MNPFRSRKKLQDVGDVQPSSNTPPTLPSTSSRSRTFRRKKPTPEPKLELDLSTVLPPSDNFRTSLIMPNLSARFSMLRDQDNPNTKIGKANDDSVLFPKRASRLNLFALDNLGDIAEVSSLGDTIRPPFANDRTQSYASADGYGTDDDASQNGSVMSRAKPGQGNKFFGGRQKIYKIPVSGSASVKDLDSGSNGNSMTSKGMGKAVYDDDIAISAFQALRAQEDEHRYGQAITSDEPFLERSSRETDRQDSPTLTNYNRNRETSSSTASGPTNTRMSTAATSVASQSASSLHGPIPNTGSVNTAATKSNVKPSLTTSSGQERGGAKTKRLYDQGLDQHIHEQQFSAMHRLNSIQRPRVYGGAPSPKASRSATNLNERFQRPSPLYTSNNFRAASPSPPPPIVSGLAGFDLGLAKSDPAIEGRNDEPGFGRSPDFSPPMSPTSHVSPFLAYMEPNDLGKATASGAFAKPTRQYDDQQYAQRQLQLQESRESPPPRALSRTTTTEDTAGRLRNGSASSEQSSQGSRTYHPLQPVSDHVLDTTSEAPRAKSRPSPIDTRQAGGTFLSGRSSSEDNAGDQSASPEPSDLQLHQFQNALQTGDVQRPRRYIHDDQHPAFQHDNVDSSLDQSPVLPASQTQFDNTGHNDNSTHLLDPGAGLSGLVKAHLRNESNQSSIYPDTPGARFSTESHRGERFVDRDQFDQTPSTNARDAWISSMSQRAAAEPIEDEPSMPPPLSTRAKQMLEHATKLKAGSDKAQQVLGPLGNDKQQQVLGSEAPARQSQESSNTSWQDQVKAHHTRGASTETQKEREEFASELANRRRRVQDNLKSFVEAESRSSSPMPGSQPQDNNPAKVSGAFGLLKKASRGSLIGRGENSSKAMKMLGIGSSSTSNSSSPRPSQEAFLNEIHELPHPANLEYPRSLSQQEQGSGAPSRPLRGPAPSFRERSIGAERRANWRAGRLPSKAAQASIRERAELQASPPKLKQNRAPTQPRSEPPSRNITSAHGFYPQSQPSRQHSSPGPAPGPRSATPTQHPPSAPSGRSQSAMSGRIRSTSTTQAPALDYFTSKSPPPIQIPPHLSTPQPIGRNPRASPIPPSTALPTPSLIQPSPTTPTIQSPPPPNTTRVNAARKRSINKQDISEPYFLMGTSSVTTIDLPTGASLANGMAEIRAADAAAAAPPVPPLNPRRKRTMTTQQVFGLGKGPGKSLGFGDKGTEAVVVVQEEERAMFELDGEGEGNEGVGRLRGRIRKMESEGLGLNKKARAQGQVERERMLSPQGQGRQIVVGGMF